MKTWAVPLVRHSEPFLKWTREELKQIDQRTSKLRILNKALHPRDTDYMSRKEEGRGFTSSEDSVDPSIQRLEEYLDRHWLKPPETILTTRGLTEQK